MLLYKDDWADAQAHFLAWWQGETIDRVALGIYAPRETPLGDATVPPEPPIGGRYSPDVDYRIARAEAEFARTRYLGEALPAFSGSLGPGSMALYLGSEPTFDDQTVWYGQTLDSLQTPPTLAYDPDNRWWRRTLELARAGVTRGRGRFVTTHPDIVENLDVLASLRGTHDLLIDLLDHPDSVEAALRQINALYFRYYDAIQDLIEPATPGGGSVCVYHNLWGPGRVIKIQSDFSAMISPRMFDEFVAPYLTEQCQRTDYSSYHLDGPGQLPHVDALLAIRELDAIQWIPGAGKPDVGSPAWYGLYRRIRSAGKLLVLLNMRPQDVEAVVREVGPEGLFITTAVESEREGERMLRAARDWTRRNR